MQLLHFKLKNTEHLIELGANYIIVHSQMPIEIQLISKIDKKRLKNYNVFNHLLIPSILTNDLIKRKSEKKGSLGLVLIDFILNDIKNDVKYFLISPDGFDLNSILELIAFFNSFNLKSDISFVLFLDGKSYYQLFEDSYSLSIPMEHIKLRKEKKIFKIRK